LVTRFRESASRSFTIEFWEHLRHANHGGYLRAHDSGERRYSNRQTNVASGGGARGVDYKAGKFSRRAARPPVLGDFGSDRRNSALHLVHSGSDARGTYSFQFRSHQRHGNRSWYLLIYGASRGQQHAASAGHSRLFDYRCPHFDDNNSQAAERVYR